MYLLVYYCFIESQNELKNVTQLHGNEYLNIMSV